MAVVVPIVAAVAGSAISSGMSSGGSGSGGGAGGGGGYTGYVPNSLGPVDTNYVDKSNSYLTDAGSYLTGNVRPALDKFVDSSTARNNLISDTVIPSATTALQGLQTNSALANANVGNAQQHALDIYRESEGYVPGAERYRDSAYGDASTIRGYATSAIPYAQQLLQQGFDPEGALRSRETQSLTDQVRAGLAARGIDMGGAGAGIENKALSDFSLDWQDRALGRGATALAGANSTFSNATSNLGTASGLEKSGTDTVTNALNQRIAALGAGDTIEGRAIGLQGDAATRLGAGASGLAQTGSTLLDNNLRTLAPMFSYSGAQQGLADADLSNLYRYLSLGTGASATAAGQRANNASAIGGAAGTLAGKGWDYFNKDGSSGSGTSSGATEYGGDWW